MGADTDIEYTGPRFPLTKVLTTHSDEEIVILFMQGRLEGNYVLSEALQKKKKRWQACADFLRQYNQHETVPMMMELFEISESQAIRDCKSAKKVFNTLSADQYENRDFTIEGLLKKQKEIYELAKAAGDYKSAVNALKEEAKAIKDFYGGDEARKYKKLKIPDIIFGHFSVLDKIQTTDDLEAEALAIANADKKKFIAWNIQAEDVDDLSEAEKEKDA